MSLAALVPENKWPLGALRFLLRWRSCVGLEVWQDLAARPDLAETIFESTGKLPFWPSLCARRFLGLFNAALYTDDACLELGGGAKSVLDWLTGIDFDIPVAILALGWGSVCRRQRLRLEGTSQSWRTDSLFIKKSCPSSHHNFSYELLPRHHTETVNVLLTLSRW